MNTPSISIITISYNISETIEATCKSIATQTTKNFEWIVIDGGSTDGTLEILNKYKKLMSVLISEKDRGVYDAMNKGIKKATGDYLLFMNGGDSYTNSNVLEKITKAIGKDDVYYGDYNVLNSDGTVVISRYPEKIDKYYLLDHCLGHQATAIRKELFSKYGLYDTQYRISADYEKWLHFLSNGVTFKKMDITVSNFRNYGGLSSSRKSDALRRSENWKILNKYFTNQEIQDFAQDRIMRLENELIDIKSTKFFKLWRKYCSIKELVFKPKLDGR